MKNKKIILVTAVVAVLFLIPLGYFGGKVLNKKPSQNSLSNQGRQQNALPSSEESAGTVLNGNVFDLIKLGKTLKCTYSLDTEDVNMSGTTYVSGKNMRADFENTTPNSDKIQSHMISDGDWVYTWTSASPQGLKIDINKFQSENSAPNEDNTEGEQNLKTFNNEMDFKCMPWNEDMSLFEVPSDITFTDFSIPVTDTEFNNNMSLCNTCDQLQDAEAKATCKEQLECQ